MIAVASRIRSGNDVTDLRASESATNWPARPPTESLIAKNWRDITTALWSCTPSLDSTVSITTRSEPGSLEMSAWRSLTSATLRLVIAQSRNIASTTDPMATTAPMPPSRIHAVRMPPVSAAMPRKSPPTQMSTTITSVPAASRVPRCTSVRKLSTARWARSRCVRHRDGSVPRQTADVTPDPAAIDADARDHVIVEGPDALTYLHSQIAQDIRDLAVGDSRWTLVLEPTGKVESLARVTRSNDEVFDFDTDAGFGEALAARLSRFKIRVQAEISRGAGSFGGPIGSTRGRPRGRWMATDGLRDRAGRDDSSGARASLRSR